MIFHFFNSKIENFFLVFYCFVTASVKMQSRFYRLLHGPVKSALFLPVFQHIFNKNSVALRRVVHKYMSNCSDQLSVL